MRDATEALIVIDVQNDFCPGGALAVAGGDEIITRINALLGEFGVKVFTQDWHPADHASFAANHPGAAPFSVTQMAYGPQVLWPTHCVQGTDGAAFHPRQSHSRSLWRTATALAPLFERASSPDRVMRPDRDRLYRRRPPNSPAQAKGAMVNALAFEPRC